MASIEVITAATVYPVTLAQAKEQLRVSHSGDDDLINGCISAATEFAEAYCQRKFALRTMEQTQDGFGSVILLEAGPVISVTSVKYDDADGVEQTMTTSPVQYELDSVNAVIYLPYGETWPAARSHWNSVRIRFDVGYYTSASPEDYRATIPDSAKQGILMVTADLYENAEAGQMAERYENKMAKMMLHSQRVWS